MLKCYALKGVMGVNLYMIDFDDLKKEKKVIKRNLKKDFNMFYQKGKRLDSLNQTMIEADYIVDAIDFKLEKSIQIKKEDMAFLWVAVALQTIRQILLEFPERTPHNVSDIKAHEAEKNVFSNDWFEKNKDFKNRYYYNPLKDIVSKGVPYDVVKNTKKFNLGDGVDLNKGFSADSHRIKTLGHDPLLGYVFGTANILTSTLTTNKGITVHVKHGEVYANASTRKMMQYATDRVKTDKKSFVAALIKQYLHIRSDEYSIDGLPLPGMSITSEELTNWLMDFDFDYANVKNIGKQMAYAQLINSVILALYGIMNYQKEDSATVKVKGYKIIEYSNIIASTSNIIRVYITADISKLDIGGLFTTVYSIVNSKKIQYDLKKEFMEKELNSYLDFMGGYNA